MQAGHLRGDLRGRLVTRPSLAGIEPFSASPWSFQPWGGQNQNGDYAESILFDAHGEELTYGLPNADGALIAAAPALLAAVREVLAEVERFRFTGLGIPSGFDEGTDTAAYAIFCALAARLDLTDPEGDPT